MPKIVLGRDGRMNIRIIEGVKQPPPDTGQRWVGADLTAGLGLEDMSRTFRVLATGLIVLGMAGIGLTFTVARTLMETLAALTGSERGMRES